MLNCPSYGIPFHVQSSIIAHKNISLFYWVLLLYCCNSIIILLQQLWYILWAESFLIMFVFVRVVFLWVYTTSRGATCHNPSHVDKVVWCLFEVENEAQPSQFINDVDEYAFTFTLGSVLVQDATMTWRFHQ